MILREYEHFLLDLSKKAVPDDVKRIGNIVLKHFNILAPLGTGHGNRSRKFIELAQNEFASTVPGITITAGAILGGGFTIKRLKSIVIESFRGFTQKETFDLDAPIVLLYGPNGSGKSSFCEALEFSLLGSVEEAEQKRFSNASDYIRNARTNKYMLPILTAVNKNGDPVPISSNDELFRFCFVEKNRIDNFSRIAAKAPAQQSKLIGTLFGLESFDEFVKGFSNGLDSKYIDLSGQKAIQLKDKRINLAADEMILKSAVKDLEELTAAENKTASEFKPNMNYSNFVAYLGTQETPGRIQKLEQLTEKPLSKKIGLKLESLNKLDASLKDSYEKIKCFEKELESKRSQISFRNLYQAVIELRKENPNVCPACSTPLQNVCQDPYLRADRGLQDLEHLSALEQDLSKERELHQNSLCKFYQLVKCTYDFEQSVSENEKLMPNREIPNSDNEATSEWWLSFKQQTETGISLWQEIEKLIKRIEEYDNGIDKIETERKSLLLELKQLRSCRESVVRHDEARKKKNESIEKAKKAIEQFETENKILIEEAESEKPIIEINNRIAKAYYEFIQNLNIYLKSLPGQLITDLADKVKLLYNGFNRSDPAGDLLKEIRLPLATGSKIEIAFCSKPTLFFDALHVLSEGHIRCLGLSILLAKNLKQQCPFLIFDDPVNAIDDDHREGIRKTIFEDGLFLDTQILLTCHGEEFFKDVQNLLGAERSKETKTFSFIPHSGDNLIQVDSSPSSRNYVVVARERFNKSEIRESLANGRRALECLAHDTWKFIARHGDGNLSLKFREPKGKPELRNLVEQLIIKVNKTEFIHKHKDAIFTALSSLCGIDGNSREWRYLNKGTHEEEDRSEFDRSTVKTIVESLESLDAVLKSK